VVAIAGGLALPALYGLASGVSVALAAYGIWRDGRRLPGSPRNEGIAQPIPVG
jgi:hypothetical protein